MEKFSRTRRKRDGLCILVLFLVLNAYGFYLQTKEFKVDSNLKFTSDVEMFQVSTEKAELPSEELVEVETIQFPISLNSATVEELMALPGIGETKAQDIIDYRDNIGEFHTLEEIQNVSGIGEGIFTQVQELLVLD